MPNHQIQNITCCDFIKSISVITLLHGYYHLRLTSLIEEHIISVLFVFHQNQLHFLQMQYYIINWFLFPSPHRYTTNTFHQLLNQTTFDSSPNWIEFPFDAIVIKYLLDLQNIPQKIYHEVEKTFHDHLCTVKSPKSSAFPIVWISNNL